MLQIKTASGAINILCHTCVGELIELFHSQRLCGEKIQSTNFGEPLFSQLVPVVFSAYWQRGD